MTQAVAPSKGWYLSMPYMHGEGGIKVTRAQKIPEQLRHCPHVFCDEVLLQSPQWREFMKDWFDALAEGGRLCLWVPDVRFVPSKQGQRGIVFGDVIEAVKSWAEHYTILEADLIDGHSFVVVEKTRGAGKNFSWFKRDKHALVVRTGAHGDALMAASILPGLKEQGWYLTMLTRQAGYDVLKYDPHIDEFLLLAGNQLTDGEQPAFWNAWAPRFDRIINLNGTVEGALLKQPHHGDFWWGDSQRRAMCGGSYLAYAHKAAEVPTPYRVKFYPGDLERDWAARTAQKLGIFVLWSLQGSSVHKWWPYTPKAICQLLAKTDLTFVLTGDKSAVDLENEILAAVVDYFGDAKRVHSLVNEKPIRHVMALAQHASIVIGPETGILNAVCLEDMAKIVMLSHSAPSNLTNDWVNTTALMPTAACYPCHRLHHSHDYCPQDAATGAAACAASITVKQVVDAVLSCAGRSAALPLQKVG